MTTKFDRKTFSNIPQNQIFKDSLFPNPSAPNSERTTMLFQDFCESTGLHGWKYVSKVKSGGKVLWLLIVLSSLGVATLFLHTSIVDFTSSTVVTTIDTTTAPLSDVYFPSVILCSINQIRKSLFRGMGVTNSSTIKLLFEHFYTGRDTPLNPEEEEIISEIATRKEMVQRLMVMWYLYSDTNSTDRDALEKERHFDSYMREWEGFLHNNSDFIKTFDYIRDLAVEDPGDSPIIEARFGQMSSPVNNTGILPFFGTDFGYCAIIRPQIQFSPDHVYLPWDQKLFGPDEKSTYSWNIKKGAKVGKANGLTLLLDAETFDYMYQIKPSEGFKMAVQHHLDQPLMSVNELDISPGFESQVAIIPTLYTTTEEAISRFSSSERGCFNQKEVILKYLPNNYPKEMYRYGIGNCLFEATYEEVLSSCKCTPYFHWGPVTLGEILTERPFCKGPALKCMNNIFGRIGEFNMISKREDNTSVKSDKRVPCLAACEDQINGISISQSILPNRETLTQRPEFCQIVERLRKSCQGWKRESVDDHYPGLCLSILIHTGKGLCVGATLTETLLTSNKSDSINSLVDQIYRYSRDNLALVNVYIKNPVVTRITRDQKIPIIWFVANSGGILGLCMGFSMVTVFEVLHYIICCIWNIIRKKLKKEPDCCFIIKDSTPSGSLRPSGSSCSLNALSCSPTRPSHTYSPSRPSHLYSPTRPSQTYSPSRPSQTYSPTRPSHCSCHMTQPGTKYLCHSKEVQSYGVRGFDARQIENSEETARMLNLTFATRKAVKRVKNKARKPHRCKSECGGKHRVVSARECRLNSKETLSFSCSQIPSARVQTPVCEDDLVCAKLGCFQSNENLDDFHDLGDDQNINTNGSAVIELSANHREDMLDLSKDFSNSRIHLRNMRSSEVEILEEGGKNRQKMNGFKSSVNCSHDMTPKNKVKSSAMYLNNSCMWCQRCSSTNS